jgi:hypothetical protein
MALTTDKWIGTSSADWGASSANWSRGLPNSNSNVVIDTTAVLTVTYSGSDIFVVHSLTVGNDIFDMTGGSLTITTTASFADGFTQTGGTLTAGGAVTVKGTGLLTGSLAEGKTAFVFDGTVTLNNYTLGGSTSLTNEKTTNLTGQVELGDNTGANATIDNNKSGVFDIGGDFGIGAGAATALFVNGGTLEKTGGTGTSFIDVNFTDTGNIVVATAGTIEFRGPQDSFAGAISGAGQVYLGGGGKDAINKGTTVTAAIFTISDGGTVATLNESLSLANAFNLVSSATLDLAAVTLTLSGTDNFSSAELNGNGSLVTTKASATNVSFSTLGGSDIWQNFGIVGEAGTFQLGDNNSFNAAIFINEKGGKYEFTNDNGINIGFNGAFGSLFLNQGTLEKTAGSGTSQIFAEVTDTGAIVVQSGTIEFGGFASSFAGAISGAGTFEIGGGVNVIQKGAAITTAVFDIVNSPLVTLGENLSYAHTFSFTGGVVNLNGFGLTLSGSDTFSNATFDGTGTLVTAKGSAIGIGPSNVVVLGGALRWENFGTISEFNTLQIGDSSLDRAEFINMKGGTLNFTTDVGIALGAIPTSSFVNVAGATLAKTGGSGDSQISVDFTNNGAVIVNTGEIEFHAPVSGTGKFTIEPGTVLQFDSTVAHGSNIVFATRTGGELSLLDSQGFAATITGFGGSSTDKVYLNDINFNSGAFNMNYRQTSKTGGVLTVSDGTHVATLDFFGKYTLANFHASSLNGGTMIVDPGSHALLASAR